MTTEKGNKSYNDCLLRLIGRGPYRDHANVQKPFVARKVNLSLNNVASCANIQRDLSLNNVVSCANIQRDFSLNNVASCANIQRD